MTSEAKPMKPIRLTLRQVARAALKAHKEDRLQATTKTVEARSSGGCYYRDGKNASGQTICCVIGSSIPDAIARAWDEEGANIESLLDDGLAASSQPKELIALQQLHDEVTRGFGSRVKLLRKLHSLAR